MTHYIDRTHAARSLGGDVTQNGIVCPGPGHSARDRSLSVMLDPDAPEGFIVHSFSDDDPIQCREHVRAKLGLPDWQPAKSDRLHPIMTKPKIVCHYVYNDEHGEPYLLVTRKSDKSFLQSHWNGVDGWNSGKPKGPVIPYRLPEIIARPDETIWLVEGEKDADNLSALGLLATTAPGGGMSFPLTPDFGKWFDGRKVIAIADNDPTGAKWRDRVTQAIADVTHISMPSPHKDVTDWLTAGGTVDALQDMALYPVDNLALENTQGQPALITPTPFQWAEPSSIAPREWLYGDHLIRKFVSLTVSPGGLGKSSLALVESMAMASGRALLEDSPVHEPEPLRVWYWNGEDPQDETQRRVVAAAKHYGLKPSDFASRLFTDTGREQAITLGQIVRGEIDLCEKLFLALEAAMIDNAIDVLVLDPFVSAHRMGENDNNAIDAVIKRLGKLADRTNAAVEIVHHVRKPSKSDEETDVNDARGASALLGGVRSARVLNVMSKDIAKKAHIPDDLRLRHFSVTNGKANMTTKSSSGQWRFLESVCLDNAQGHRKSDNVGVVTYYELPAEAQDAADLSGAEDAMRLILSTDDMVRHWRGKGPVPQNWIVHRIMDELNIHDETKQAVIHNLVLGWLDEGTIVTRSTTVKNNRVTVLTLPGQAFVVENPSDDPF